MTHLHASRRKGNPASVALSNALDQALREGAEEGVSAEYVATYLLGISAGQLSKYRNPDDPDQLPAAMYPLVAKGTGSLALVRLLAQLHGQALADVGDETAPVGGDLVGLLSALAVDGGKTLSAALQAWEEDHHQLRDEHKEAVYVSIQRELRELERLSEIFRPACRLRKGA